MNTSVEDVRDDSSEEDDNEDNYDNASEMVSASKETTRDKDTQDSEASGLTPSNKKHNIRESATRNKDYQNKKNLKSAWKNLQNPKRNQTKNFWKK